MSSSSLSLILRGGILVAAASSASATSIRFSRRHHRHRVVDDAFASFPASSSFKTTSLHRRRATLRSSSSSLFSSSSSDAGNPITTTTTTTTTTAKSSRRGGGVSSTTHHGAIVARPLVVCGPSGVGKGTIVSRFMEGQDERRRRRLLPRRHPPLPEFSFSVSHTTRQPRPGEIDGVHYNFVTREYMLDAISSGKSYFVEHAEVHGNLYGTSFDSMFFPSAMATTTTTTTTTASGTWMCGDRNSSIGDDDVIDNVERQRILDIDVAGVRSIKEFQMRQRRLRREPNDAGGDRRSATMGDGPILGKGRSTSQYDVGGGRAQGGGSRVEEGVKNDDMTKTTSSTSSTTSTDDDDDAILLLPDLDAKFVFIAPPSIEILRERLMNRGTETNETLERRLSNAMAEIEYGTEPGNFDAIIVNNDLDDACSEFDRVVEVLYLGGG